MNSKLFTLAIAAFPGVAGACVACRSPQGTLVRSEIFSPQFIQHLFQGLLLPLVASIIIVLLTKRNVFTDYRKNLRGALFLGAGLGGLFDAIFFRQILQLHNMASAQNFPVDMVSLETNLFWDGYYYLLCLAVAAAGVAYLWRSKEKARSWSLLGGSLLAGWGVFSFFEGLFYHVIFQLHHINERVATHETTDFIYLMVAVAQFAVGYWMMRGRKVPHFQRRVREPYYT